MLGKILCAGEDDKDRIAGRFRIYYADFELAANHGVSNFEVLDAHQHTLEYADAILHPAEGPFSARLEKLFGDFPVIGQSVSKTMRQRQRMVQLAKMRLMKATFGHRFSSKCSKTLNPLIKDQC